MQDAVICDRIANDSWEKIRRANISISIATMCVSAGREQIDKEFKDVEIPSDVFNNMETYMNSVALKRTTLSFIASRIPEEHIE